MTHFGSRRGDGLSARILLPSDIEHDAIDEALNAALEATFPGSDPIVSLPAVPDRRPSLDRDADS